MDESAKLFGEWNKLGYKIIYGEKSILRSDSGDALFFF